MFCLGMSCLCPKILIMYDSITGNTEKLAKAVAKGVKRCEVTVELKRTEEVDLQEVIDADGYAIGSPSHFSVMSGKVLTLLTKLYSIESNYTRKEFLLLLF